MRTGEAGEGRNAALAADNVFLPTDYQLQLARKRSQTELARATSSRNWLVLITLTALIIAAFSVWQMKVANDRFANNVRVAWVKLMPSGQAQVEYFEGTGENRFFEATVNASLINYVEHRFRQKKATIVSDYGFAMHFMGAAVQAEFLQAFDAARVAADFEACPSCDERQVKIRAIDHNQIISPDARNAHTAIYESSVYTTEELTTGGQVGRRESKIVKLTWSLRPVEELARNLELLKVNPLGLQILEQRVISDLAPEPRR